MVPGEDLLQEGISAFQAGDRVKAHDLLSEVVKLDPTNEQAWYYLAACETDPALRKSYLEQVLEINPDNAKAREVLQRIQARELAAAPEDQTTAAPRPASGDRKSRIRPLDPDMASAELGAAASEQGSFKLPVKIPGAPERVQPERLARDGIALLRTGLDVLMRKPGAYSEEVASATWWRFWLISGTAAAAGAVLALFNALFIVIRYGGSLFSFVSILLTPFFAIAIALVTLYVGCYASYRWAQTKGGSSSLVKHCYTIAVVWAPMTVLNAVISFVFHLIGIGVGLITLAISIYALVVIADGLQDLHVFSEPNQKWITAAAMVVGVIVSTLILGLLFSWLIVAGALPFALS